MNDDLQYKERYSVCIAKVDGGLERRFYKFYRIADYDPTSPNELVPSVVESHVGSLEERRKHPNYLYNPKAVSEYAGRESDYYLFSWGWGYDENNRPLTSVLDARQLFKHGNELKEVIFPDGIHDENELRHALREGIPFDGRTTRVFYLVYGEDGQSLLAARCERDDFSFSNGILSLPPKVTNVRNHALRVPRVRLDPSDIIASPHQDVPDRKVYGNLSELEHDGNVLLRLLDDFADDYVSWFIKEEEIYQLTNAERKRIMYRIINTALERPDALERYLESGVPADDIESLKRAIVARASDKDDVAHKLICSALLKNDSFRNECLEQVMADSAAALSEKKREIGAASNQLAQINKELAEASRKLGDASAERDTICAEIASRRAELDKIAKDSQSAFEELEANIALRLGLKAVASTNGGSQSVSPKPIVTNPTDAEKLVETETLIEALSKNMQRLGVSCLDGNPVEEIRHASVGIEAAIKSTSILALPAPVAQPIADSIAIAMAGKFAKRIQIPSDYRDFQSIKDELPGPGEVAILDNVIDPVNEGMLFPLVRSNDSGVIILSFTSHASALLVAKEAWDEMFLPCVESLCLIPSASRPNGKLWRCKDAFEAGRTDAEEILSIVRDLISDFDDLNLPNTSFLLPATVQAAFEESDKGAAFEPLSIISQHLGMVTGLEGDSYRSIASKSEGDIGLMQLARRLGRDVV